MTSRLHWAKAFLVVITLALPGVSQANVDFYKKHEAEMKSIGDNDPCDDDTDADDEGDDS
jgi:hypothetical protein